MKAYYLILKIFKTILPSRFVKYLNSLRRSRRYKKYFKINNGKDLIKEIIIEGISFKLILNPYLNVFIDYFIYLNGVWEPNISKQIKQFLPKDGVFLDIGANIGYHSIFAACYLNSFGQVIAFEPIPYLAEQIKNSITLNHLKNIKVENFALSNKFGSAPMSLIDENIGASTLKKVMNKNLVKEKINVKVSTLDFFLENLSRLDLIKIDVEGNEFETLIGGKKLLEKFHPIIIMEFSPTLYEFDYRGKTKKFEIFLSNLGYSFYSTFNEKIDLHTLNLSQNEQYNIICR